MSVYDYKTLAVIAGVRLDKIDPVIQGLKQNRTDDDIRSALLKSGVVSKELDAEILQTQKELTKMYLKADKETQKGLVEIMEVNLVGAILKGDKAEKEPPQSVSNPSVTAASCSQRHIAIS